MRAGSGNNEKTGKKSLQSKQFLYLSLFIELEFGAHKKKCCVCTYARYESSLTWEESSKLVWTHHSSDPQRAKTYTCNGVFVSKQCMSAPASSNTCKKNDGDVSASQTRSSSHFHLTKSSLTIISPVHSRLRRWTDRCYFSTGKCGINVRKDDLQRKAAGLLGAGRTHVRINRRSVTVWGWCQRWLRRLQGTRPGGLEDWLPVQYQKWISPAWKCMRFSNKHEKSFLEMVPWSYFHLVVTRWRCYKWLADFIRYRFPSTLQPKYLNESRSRRSSRRIWTVSDQEEIWRARVFISCRFIHLKWIRKYYFIW